MGALLSMLPSLVFLSSPPRCGEEEGGHEDVAMG